MSRKPLTPLECRREFLRFLMASPFYGSGLLALSGCASRGPTQSRSEYRQADYCAEVPLVRADFITSPEHAYNVFQFESVMQTKVDDVVFSYLACGADDNKTLRANRLAFDHYQIRPRRLVNVASVDTSIELFGKKYHSPIALAPCGIQSPFHPDKEFAVARAAAKKKHLMMLSTVATAGVDEIAPLVDRDLWFQLYPTPDRSVTKELLRRAEAAGCPTVVLTLDSPILGNRERANLFMPFLRKLMTEGDLKNFKGLPPPLQPFDPALTWDYVKWVRSNTRMKVVLKAIVTKEDAHLAVQHGADGIIVSNHGGRQEESLRSTLESLPEVVAAVKGRIPVLVDSGFRRGSDIFKALALGARAVCIGRPYLWGLGAFGQPGVEQVLDILQRELQQTMKLAGTQSIAGITSTSIQRGTVFGPWPRNI